MIRLIARELRSTAADITKKPICPVSPSIILLKPTPLMGVVPSGEAYDPIQYCNDGA